MLCKNKIWKVVRSCDTSSYHIWNHISLCVDTDFFSVVLYFTHVKCLYLSQKNHWYIINNNTCITCMYIILYASGHIPWTVQADPIQYFLCVGINGLRAYNFCPVCFSVSSVCVQKKTLPRTSEWSVIELSYSTCVFILVRAFLCYLS